LGRPPMTEPPMVTPAISALPILPAVIGDRRTSPPMVTEPVARLNVAALGMRRRRAHGDAGQRAVDDSARRSRRRRGYRRRSSPGQTCRWDDFTAARSRRR
jgi:hypothetical protein